MSEIVSYIPTSYEKAPELFNFHLLLSKEDKFLSKSDKYNISEIARKYNYIEKLSTVFQKNYIDVRTQWNRSGIQRKHFFLIATDSTGVPEFEGKYSVTRTLPIP